MIRWLEKMASCNEIKTQSCIEDPLLGWIEVFPKGFIKRFAHPEFGKFLVRVLQAPSPIAKARIEDALANLEELMEVSKASVAHPHGSGGTTPFSRKNLYLNSILIDSSAPAELVVYLGHSFGEDEFFPEVCVLREGDKYTVKYSIWSS